MRRGSATSAAPHSPPPTASDLVENTPIAASRSNRGTSPATASKYTPRPVPIGTVESKITIPTSGRTARLREWRVSGRDTQSSRVGDSGANHTGLAHGAPSASAVARVMYGVRSRIARALRSSSC